MVGKSQKNVTAADGTNNTHRLLYYDSAKTSRETKYIMKYYVVSDIHGFFSILQSALDDAGYFADTQPHKLVILGDLFDGGSEAKALQSFLLGLMDRGEVILIKGNHEDQFVDTFSSGKAPPYSHHAANEIYDTALQLTDCNWIMAQLRYICYG